MRYKITVVLSDGTKTHIKEPAREPYVSYGALIVPEINGVLMLIADGVWMRAVATPVDGEDDENST